ncbi:Zinc finger, PMZ-type [Sesbania bispinosa]|nr:Zinc finger, PMZ-type [Sesbania bispinosa]
MDHVNVPLEVVAVVNEGDEFRQSENVNITMDGQDVHMEEAEDNIEIEAGMRFDNAEEAKRLYQEFAIRKGFAIVTRNSRKGPDGKVIEDLYVGGNPREAKYVVRFSRDPVSVECNCLLFEFKGILCRHALTVLSQERVKEVPNVYLLPRWSKNVRRKHTYIKCSYDAKQHGPKMCRFDELCKDFYMVAEIAAETPEGTSLLAQTILGVKDKVKAIGACTQNLYSNEEVHRTEQVEERIC